jgi:HNH endonuclease
MSTSLSTNIMFPKAIRMECNITPSQILLFHEKYSRGDGCWEWGAAKLKSGYGNFGIGSRTNRTKRPALAHRIAFYLANGWVPSGYRHIVRHTCDNPSCVNPEHLVADSQLGNVRDCIEKGRKTTPPIAKKRWPDFVTNLISVRGISERTARKLFRMPRTTYYRYWQ